MTLIDRHLPPIPGAPAVPTHLKTPTHHPATERRVPISEAAYYQLPDPRVEFVHGEALFMSPVSLSHARLEVWLISYMDALVQRTGAGTIYPDSVTVRLSPTVSRVPDLSFVATTNTRAQLKENHIDGPPDLVIEIVSPESRIRDYHYKFNDYEAAGIPEYWIIDPTFQTIDLFRLDPTGHYAQIPDVNGALTSTTLPGLTLRPEWLKLPSLPKLTELL